MPTPNRPKLPTSVDGLEWLTTDDGSRTLWDARLNETYHSGCGAIAESLVVYLQNSGVHAALRSGQARAVLEYGFGTGLAFLLTAADAVLHRTPLHYRALELKLVPAEVLQELQWIEASLAEPIEAEFSPLLEIANRLLVQLVTWRQSLPQAVPPGIYGFQLDECVRLELVVGDATEYAADPNCRFDAVYFDPFSPDSCPELWCSQVYRTAFESLVAGGTFTSYCVKASVRRSLQDIGFNVFRLPGPPRGKREVLLATKTTLLANTNAGQSVLESTT